jgi:hypothetical protein
MADEYSGPPQLTLDGIPVLEIEDIKVTIKTNDNEVVTLVGGLQGFSNGANVQEINFSSAIPLAGFEIDYMELARLKRTKTWGVKIAGKVIKVRGRFMDVEVAISPNAPNKLSGSFKGKPV